jgi:FkbM family methyltransferase
MASALKRFLKPVGGPVLAYLRRLRIWLSIIADIRGASFTDELRMLASVLASPVTALRRLDRWADPICLVSFTAVVRGIGRFEVRAGTDDLFHVTPMRERPLIDYLRAHLRPGDVFVDAGANIGFYTVLAARLVGEGRVYAIEMMDETAGALRRHLALNGLTNVTVIQRALSDRTGDIVHASVPRGSWGQASIIRSSDSHGQDVPTITLDDAIDEPAIRVMKMDVEGAEKLTIAGGVRTLANTRALIFEANAMFGDQELVAQIARAGFAVRSLDACNDVAERG